MQSHQTTNIGSPLVHFSVPADNVINIAFIIITIIILVMGTCNSTIVQQINVFRMQLPPKNKKMEIKIVRLKCMKKHEHFV